MLICDFWKEWRSYHVLLVCTTLFVTDIFQYHQRWYTVFPYGSYPIHG